MAQKRRAGFTLVEMLMVVGIMVLIASILVPVSLRFTERSNVSTGISVLQGQLAQARTRALATGKPAGIRLLAMRPEDRTVPPVPGGPALAWYDRIEYIEAEGEFCEGFVWAPVDPNLVGAGPPPGPSPPNPQHLMLHPHFTGGASPLYPGVDRPARVDSIDVNPYIRTFAGVVAGDFVSIAANRTVFGPFENPGATPQPTFVNPPAGVQVRQLQAFSFALTSTALQPLVEADDILEIQGISQPYRILQVNKPFNLAGANGQPARRTPSSLVVDRPLPHDINPPLSGQPNYRIYRQPRVVPGMSAQKLPGEVVIDLTPRTGLAVQTNRDVTDALWMRGVSQGITLTNPAPAPFPGVAPRYVDIMFSPSGQLMPGTRTFAANEFFTVSSDGILYLWLHPKAAPSAWANRSMTAASGELDNQGLISINGITGSVGSYRINQDAAAGNPWADAQKGRADGVGGL